MFILPKGITGLDSTADASEKSFSKFKSSCFEAARRSKGRASEYASAGITPNFHLARIKNGDFDLSVVCNAAFGIVATAEPLTQSFLEFIDQSELQKSFKLQGYKIIESAILGEPLSEENMAQLDVSEIKQLKYWKSKTVGEVIFNWYD